MGLLPLMCFPNELPGFYKRRVKRGRDYPPRTPNRPPWQAFPSTSKRAKHASTVLTKGSEWGGMQLPYLLPASVPKLKTICAQTPSLFDPGREADAVALAWSWDHHGEGHMSGNRRPWPK
jgi:hypothetical protein